MVCSSSSSCCCNSMDMYNNNTEQQCCQQMISNSQLISPRISFSNDFVLDSSSSSSSQGASTIKVDRRRAAAADPSVSDFEFTPTSSSSPMIPADEVFFNGRLLPSEEMISNSRSHLHKTITTLRDELHGRDDHDHMDHDVVPQSKPSTSRLKDLLRLRKASSFSHPPTIAAKSSPPLSQDARSGFQWHAKGCDSCEGGE